MSGFLREAGAVSVLADHGDGRRLSSAFTVARVEGRLTARARDGRKPLPLQTFR